MSSNVENSVSINRSVLLVGNFLSAAQGGTRGVCEDLAERLQDTGWRVITTSRASGRVARLLDMLLTTWQQRDHYTVAQVDVYSGPSFFWAEAVTWLLGRLGKPYVLTLHGGNLPAFARRWPGRMQRLLSRATAVTTPSNYLHEQLSHVRNDLLLLPNPVNLAHYTFAARRQPAPRLIWLRAFHATYNPVLAAHVLKQISDDYSDAQLIMVGPDKGDGAREMFEQTIAALGLTERVGYAGGVAKTEVPGWLNKGDIFLNTTNVDNTPVSVIEAMACGLCVVSTNVGGVPYLLEHEHDALLVPPSDPEAMADAVRRILTEPGLAERLSRNARAKAEQFDWAVILPRWEQLFSSIIDGNVS